MIFDQERFISRLDPDLAVLRSFSLNAKVAYQRQRNVARQMEAYEHGYPWDRMRRFLGKISGLNGLFGLPR